MMSWMPSKVVSMGLSENKLHLWNGTSMNETSHLSQRIANGLQTRWQTFEALLLSVSENHLFPDFLSRYKGIPEPLPVDAHRGQIAHRVTDAVKDILLGIFQDALSGDARVEVDAWQECLRSAEGALNLALYFFHAPDERNFQFRTVVHFADVSPDAILLSEQGVPDFFVRITEWGVQLSPSDSFSPFPFRFSLAKACGLSSECWQTPTEISSVRACLAQLRVIQREFCQLIDEWEHCNAILAVRQFALRKLPPEQQPHAQIILSEIGRARDQLACWCAGSAADLQAFLVNGFSAGELHADLRAELQATDALLLSGFQKFFLPASVSRHVYGAEVIGEFQRFNNERLRAEPDDLYCMISAVAFSIALGEPCDWQRIFSHLAQRSFYWSLSADPSAAVKSVAWSFSPAEHQLLVALLTLAYYYKREPDRLDEYWLYAIASVAEMPATFARAQAKRNYFPSGLDAQLKLTKQALECLRHFEPEMTAAHLDDVSSGDHGEDGAPATYRYVAEFLRAQTVTTE
ncbi:MAG: hypothetical protein RL189_2979 [Pseudomonadota bacterium]|jgi:phosphoheptose isomerase